MARTAIDYAHLVGRYIRMERPATEAELAKDPGTKNQGMETQVECVADALAPDGGPIVNIWGDEGMGYPIYPDETWSFSVWPDERVRRGYRGRRTDG